MVSLSNCLYGIVVGLLLLCWRVREVKDILEVHLFISTVAKIHSCTAIHQFIVNASPSCILL
jgi:hypothetical protein